MQVAKLSIDSAGRVTGTCPNGKPVTLNHPFPCVNGVSGGMGTRAQIRGFLPHTMVGNLAGTLSLFNRPGFDASAHFCIDQAGQIVQMGPVGPGRWKAWAEAAGNPFWISAESADNGNPDNPYTPAQLWALAQIAELTSRPDQCNYPLQVTDSTGGLGIGTHAMGGAAYGGHSCPDVPPHHVRSAQRPQIITYARQLRGTGPGHVPPPPPAFRTFTADGSKALAAIAGQVRVQPSAIIRATAEHSPRAAFTHTMAAYLDEVFAGDAGPMGKGLTWWYVKGRADKEWVTDPGVQSLSALAAQLHNDASTILQLTCERSPRGLFAPDVAGYVNAVAARSPILVPRGTVLMYP
jgi:hypothetical protein